MTLPDKFRCKNCCKHFWNRAKIKSVTLSKDDIKVECANCGNIQIETGLLAMIKYNPMEF